MRTSEILSSVVAQNAASPAVIAAARTAWLARRPGWVTDQTRIGANPHYTARQVAQCWAFATRKI